MMLVEDDRLLRESLLLFFRSRGCDMTAFADAESALEALKRSRFDLIITDHWLPGADGLSLLKRARGIRPGAYRVLITAYPSAGLASDAHAEQVDGFLLKPFTGDELESALAEVLAKAWGHDIEPEDRVPPESERGCI